MSFSITDIGRIGPNMQAAVRLAADNGAYPSIAAMARDVAPNRSVSTGEDAIRRCLNRGLLDQDTEHPIASNRSAGAIVLTEEGERFLSLFAPSLPEPDDPHATAD